MWNIVFGMIFIIGGLSGKMALIGTNSPTALAVVGGAMLLWGLVQVAKGRNAERTVSRPNDEELP